MGSHHSMITDANPFVIALNQASYTKSAVVLMVKAKTNKQREEITKKYVKHTLVAATQFSLGTTLLLLDVLDPPLATAIRNPTETNIIDAIECSLILGSLIVVTTVATGGTGDPALFVVLASGEELPVAAAFYTTDSVVTLGADEAVIVSDAGIEQGTISTAVEAQAETENEVLSSSQYYKGTKAVKWTEADPTISQEKQFTQLTLQDTNTFSTYKAYMPTAAMALGATSLTLDKFIEAVQHNTGFKVMHISGLAPIDHVTLPRSVDPNIPDYSKQSNEDASVQDIDSNGFNYWQSSLLHFLMSNTYASNKIIDILYRVFSKNIKLSRGFVLSSDYVDAIKYVAKEKRQQMLTDTNRELSTIAIHRGLRQNTI